MHGFDRTVPASAMLQPHTSRATIVSIFSVSVLVTEQYSLVATTDGAFSCHKVRTRGVPRFGRTQQQCSYYASTAFETARQHTYRCPWLSRAFCTRFRQTGGNGPLLRLLFVAALLQPPSTSFVGFESQQKGCRARRCRIQEVTLKLH
jgi:hypothetical protein